MIWLLPLVLSVATAPAPLPADSSPADSPAARERAQCEDVFDRTPGCSAVDEDPWDGVGEPLMVSNGGANNRARNGAKRAETSSARRLFDPKAPSTFSADAMAWRLIASSGVIGVFGAGLFATSFAYGTYAAELDAKPGDPLLLTEYLARVGAIAIWVSAGLLAGTGAIFFVFDPSTGRLRLDLDES